MKVKYKKTPQGFFSFVFILLFLFFFFIYYFIPLFQKETSTILLTIATFIFSIFAGFFISRQNTRHTEIRDELSRFDGGVTALYRNFTLLGSEAEEKVRKIILDYYNSFLNNSELDTLMFNKKIHFLHPLYQLLQHIAEKQTFSGLQTEAMKLILSALYTLQVLRKRIIILYEERIPLSQWVLLYVLALILLGTLSVVIESHLLFFAAALKAAFASSIIFIIIMLHRLTILSFYEKVVGSRSAQDVIDVIEGRR
jgi:hypothetical protein